MKEIDVNNLWTINYVECPQTDVNYELVYGGNIFGGIFTSMKEAWNCALKDFVLTKNEHFTNNPSEWENIDENHNKIILKADEYIFIWELQKMSIVQGEITGINKLYPKNGLEDRVNFLAEQIADIRKQISNN